jgi:hypothetical protein
MRSCVSLEVYCYSFVSLLAGFGVRCLIIDCNKLKFMTLGWLEWHIIHAKFRGNRANVSKSAREGVMILPVGPIARR